MRTRILNKMTDAEVSEYLDRNDIIIVAVGTVETHGVFPVDIETIIPEAAAVKLAEKADALCLTGLPYFYCGATAEARGSVQMSIGGGIDYLMEIARSLLRQGFRRQLWTGGHAPGFLMLGTLVNDFFHETGVPIAYCDGIGMPMKYGENVGIDDKNPGPAGFAYPLNMVSLGSYRILDRLNEVVIDPNVKWEDSFDSNITPDDDTSHFNYIFNFGPLSGQVGFYQSRPECHFTFYGAARSREELERLSVIGEKMIEDSINKFDICGFFEEMRQLDCRLRADPSSHMPGLINKA